VYFWTGLHEEVVDDCDGLSISSAGFCGVVTYVVSVFNVGGGCKTFSYFS
jgi:hypothetical protein